MWEENTGHKDEEVNAYQITPMELDNCKYDAVAKKF